MVSMVAWSTDCLLWSSFKIVSALPEPPAGSIMTFHQENCQRVGLKKRSEADFLLPDFNDPKGSIVGLFSSIMFLGGLVALPVVPYAADMLGRRMAIFIGCIIMIFGVALQSASINFRMFVAARFFIGFGVAIAHGASPLLITELVHPQHRAAYTTIYNTTWYLGSIIAAWLTFGTNHIPNHWSWRIPSLVQALPSILQLAFVWVVPESPRWHINKGHEDKALATLAKVHAEGNSKFLFFMAHTFKCRG